MKNVDGECSSIICLRSLVERKRNIQTLKLKGKINGVPVLILVDSGATHNFISKKLVAAIEWPVEDTKKMNNKLGDGHKTEARGKCKGVQIELGEVQVIIDALMFDLEGIDVVLGMAWLTTLGEMFVDWSRQIMKFQMEGKEMELRGGGNNLTTQEAFQSPFGGSKRVIDGLL
ncbi:Aspartic peptidase, active site [Sesbania bispinosa]|nr:Aspartic peptidase, active site [Sesbania bispinosa]